ncbi:hypothetical protein TeGR_g5335, partial [Tetraparma gracilis]
KTQVKAIDESEGLKPEALEQMKRELLLLQGKLVANIKKELKAASKRGEEERGAVTKEANELIACIDADSKRLDLLRAMADMHKGKGEHEKALEKYEKALEMKFLVKAIDESESLTPEELEQMKKELQLLQSKVVATIEKELKAASDKGDEERGAVIKEANELIACINADAKRLHGGLAKVVGSAEEMTVYVLQASADVHKGKGEHEKALENGLTEIKVPASLTKIADGVFKGCTALRAVELHGGVVEIGKAAFVNCSSLTEIKAAPGTKIHDGAFDGCSALEAQAKAEGFSSVNEFVVERAMPEGWAMRKGA